MPKVQVIINQINQKCPSVLPEITQAFQSDKQIIAQALKQKRQDPHEYVMLRILLSDTLYKLKSNDFLKPLLQINLIDLRSEVAIEARLKISEGIILAQDLYRTNAIDKHLLDLSTMINLTGLHNARVQAINAGNNFLKGDYTKASLQYLAAARMQANVKDQTKKTQLVNKAISFIFIAPINQESHKIICSLCLNEIAKKSKLYNLVSKLYREDIFTSEEVGVIENHLPGILKAQDNEGISKIRQAAFSRNMIPIINSFTSIKIKTLLRLIGEKSVDALLLLLEKTYQNGEISINQLTEIIYIRSTVQVSEMIKQFLGQIDTIIQQ